MAIAFDAQSAVENSGTGTLSHTISGSNTFLLVGTFQSTDDVTAVTYNSVSMTQIGSTLSHSGIFIRMYGLAAPSDGTNNIQVARTSTTSISGLSYTGVAQTGQPEVNETDTTTAATQISGTITTLTDNAFVIMMAAGDSGGNDSDVSNWNKRGLLFSKGTMGDSGPKTPTGAVTQTAGFDSSDQAAIQVVIAPFVAVGPANVKSWNGLAIASVKSINGLAIASIKNINGLA